MMPPAEDKLEYTLNHVYVLPTIYLSYYSISYTIPMNIYFAGIGGVGIGPLAEIARDAGNFIAGSDTQKSAVTYQLEDKGVSISYTQDGSHLRALHAQQPFDWFIYTAAMPASHPEMLCAQELGIKTGKRDELISDIITEHGLKLIAVAGTHGKTTTTGMLVWLFKQLRIPVSYSVGSTLSFGPSGKFDENSLYFVYECDEFDKNFLQFTPYLSLITSVDYDHPDTYPTPAEYDAAFQQFIDHSGQTIMWDKDATGRFTLPANGTLLTASDMVPTHLIGQHNRENATLVAKAAELLSIGNFSLVPELLDTFPGTARRFEQLDTNLYSDYAHHPTEIAATLQLARELSSHITLVYQPHQNIRQHQIVNSYKNCMELADKTYWLPTYLTREDPSLPVLTPQQLTVSLTNPGAVHYAELNDTLWNAIQTARQQGSLVIVMGAGTIDEWARERLTNSS